MLSTTGTENVDAERKTRHREVVSVNQEHINYLNDQINKMHRERNAISWNPPRCPKCPQISPSLPRIPTIISFAINSAIIGKEQEVSVYNVAKYMEKYQTAKVEIVGFIDQNSDTSADNKSLGEQRAKVVADMLINKYNIDRRRIRVDWHDDARQFYEGVEYNSIAILTFPYHSIDSNFSNYTD